MSTCYCCSYSPDQYNHIGHNFSSSLYVTPKLMAVQLRPHLGKVTVIFYSVIFHNLCGYRYVDLKLEDLALLLALSKDLNCLSYL